MDEYFRGEKLTIWLWPGAEESWNEAEQHIPGNRGNCPAQLRARLERLGNFGTLRSPDHIRSEGDGTFAVKATCGLRAWGWFDSADERPAYIISHVVLKDTEKADPADRERTKAAKAQYRAVRSKERSEEMSKLHEWVQSSPERQRMFAEERLIVAVAEEVWHAMEKAGVTKVELAERLGKSKAFISQVLSGSRNMTLRTLAGIAHTLNASVHFAIHEVSAFGEWDVVRDAQCIQIRRQMRVNGTVDVGNDSHWQSFSTEEVERKAA